MNYELIKGSVLLAAMALALTTSAQEAGGDSSVAPIHRAGRQTTVTNAKNMVVTTRQATYYYLVSADFMPVMHLGEGTVSIGADQFARTDIRSIRFRSLPHVLLDEDSLSFYKAGSFDHAVLALRRTLTLGQWNSLVVPFDLTGTQLRYVFGDDAELAQPRAINDDGELTLEFNTLDLTTDEVVLRANYHYLLRPTREPDIEASKRMYSFLDDDSRPYGPIYLIPDVSKKASASARLQTVQNADASRKVRFRGSYNRLDGTLISGSTVKNKKVEPGMYYLNDEGRMAFSEDSLAIQAFRSWIQDVSEEPQPLRFFIDGIGEDITAGSTPDGLQRLLGNEATEQRTPAYNLSGQRIDKSQMKRGIYIVNGRKVAIK